jgi:hypothetical protein
MVALLADGIIDGLHLEAKWLTLLPLIPMFFFIVALLLMIGKMDELQRKICQESAFLAFVLTLALTLVFLGLDHAAIVRPPWDDLGAIMLALWGVSYVFTVRRYK